MPAPPNGYRGDRPDTPNKPRKRARPNALRNAQVLPPHNVDLTLPPVTHEDIHVPAHVNGADLSRDAPADARAASAPRPGSGKVKPRAGR
jgi:hypothetical protein